MNPSCIIQVNLTLANSACGGMMMGVGGNSVVSGYAAAV